MATADPVSKGLKDVRRRTKVADSNVQKTPNAQYLFEFDEETTKVHSYFNEDKDKKKGETAGVPLHAVVHVLKKQKRQAQLHRLVPYVLFLVAFLWVETELAKVHDAFEAVDSIYYAMIGQVWPNQIYDKNYFEMRRHEDFWTWLIDTVYPTVYRTTWYNDVPLRSDQMFMVGAYNRLMCPIQIRQARVANNSCGTAPAGQDRFYPCYGPWSDESKEIDLTFGSAAGTVYKQNMSAWEGKSGFGASYGKEGYVVELPLDVTAAQDKLQAMFNNKWIDAQTRAVAVNMVTYNPSSDLTVILQANIDFAPGGRLEPDYKIWVLRLEPYNSPIDYLRLVVEIGMVLFLFYYFFEEAHEVMTRKLAYFYEFWNWIELINICLYFVIFGNWLLYLSNKQRTAYKYVSSGFQEIFSVADNYKTVLDTCAMTTIFGFLKTFKFMQSSKQLHVLWDMLISAAGDLVPFFGIFCFLVVGFMCAASVIFGYQVKNFHNLTSTFSSLLRTLIGDLDYESWKRASAEIAPVFILMWLGIVIIVLTNMFIAIVTGFFEKMKDEQQNEANVMEQYEEQPLAQDSFDKVMVRLQQASARIKAQFSINKEELLRTKPWIENPFALSRENTWEVLEAKLYDEQDESGKTTHTKEQLKEMRNRIWDSIAEANNTVKKMMDGDDLLQILSRCKGDQLDQVITIHQWNKLLKKHSAQELVNAVAALKPETVKASIATYEDPFEVFDNKISWLQEGTKLVNEHHCKVNAKLSSLEKMEQLSESADTNQQLLSLQVDALSTRQSQLSNKIDRIIGLVAGHSTPQPPPT